MLGEHIKSYDNDDKCPIGKRVCKHGLCTCRYTRERFGAVKCHYFYMDIVNKVYDKELEDRQALNVPR